MSADRLISGGVRGLSVDRCRRSKLQAVDRWACHEITVSSAIREVIGDPDCTKVPACAPWDRWRLAGFQINWAEGPAFLGTSHGKYGRLEGPK